MKLSFARFCPVLVLFCLMLTQCRYPEGGVSEECFSDPPVENRALALWTWMNGYIDTAKLMYELEEMKEKGMRGVIIWDIGSLADPDKIIPEGPSFLGPESLEYISLALKTSGRLGLDLGMVASSSWNAGGEWVLPEDASMQLLCTSQIVEGPGCKRIEIMAPEARRGQVQRYELLSTVAVPHLESGKINGLDGKTIYLDENTVENSFIDWEMPEGQWEVFSFFMCNTGQNLVCPSPNSSGLVIDHLSRIATQRHFDSILTRLDKVSTADNHIKIFMLDSYEVWRMKDWSPGLLNEFKLRYGYDPLPFLPLLLGYEGTDTIIAEKFRGDYSRLVSDMMIENHFGRSVEIADEHGIQMLTEAGHGGSPRVDPLKALGHSHIPMGEFWNRRRFWVTKEAASAAHIYGRKLIAAESLTGWNNWQHGPADFKQLIDIAFCAGLNQVVFHTFAHNPEIAGKPGFTYHAGEHINVNTTWWDMAKPFMDYIGRCSYMLRQGNFVADACLYYGDQAPNLVPPDRIDPNIEPIYGNHQCLHCGAPKPVEPGDMTGYEYDYMNAEIIVRDMKVKNGKLVLPSGMTYRVMLLPEREDINLDVLRKIEKLVYNGAVIIGPKPKRTTSLEGYPACDMEVKKIAEKVWGSCDGKNILSNKYGKGIVYWGKTVKEVLSELKVSPDFIVTGTDNTDMHIDYLHRRTENEDIYFVSNSKPEVEFIKCIYRVDKRKVPELWNPVTGLIQRDPVYTRTGEGLELELQLDPLGSVFVVFTGKAAAAGSADQAKDLQFGVFSDGNKEKSKARFDISKNWTISFNEEMGGPGSFSFENLVSWSDSEVDGIRYYSGSAHYTKDFSLGEGSFSENDRVLLTFEDIQETARVIINGNDCGILWTPPYMVEITPYVKTGNNSIEVQVINTWNNRIIGDLRNPEDKSYTRTNIKYKFSKDNELLKSGLTGKAEIIVVNRN